MTEEKLMETRQLILDRVDKLSKALEYSDDTLILDVAALIYLAALMEQFAGVGEEDFLVFCASAYRTVKTEVNIVEEMKLDAHIMQMVRPN